MKERIRPLRDVKVKLYGLEEAPEYMVRDAWTERYNRLSTLRETVLYVYTALEMDYRRGKRRTELMRCAEGRDMLRNPELLPRELRTKSEPTLPTRADVCLYCRRYPAIASKVKGRDRQDTMVVLSCLQQKHAELLKAIESQQKENMRKHYAQVQSV